MSAVLKDITVTLTVQQILVNFLVAFILGLLIFLSYRFSHSSAVYSARFNASLLMLTVVATMVMSVIGHNIALSLGMVGALSIVRFRTAIKDPRDTTYIFWSIAVGVCCGVSEYMVPAIGSGAVFLIMLLLGAVRSNERYLLIIHARECAAVEIERAVLVAYSGKATMRVKNSTKEDREYIYEVSRQVYSQKMPESRSINDILYGIEGVERVDVIMQSEEVGQ